MRKKVITLCLFLFTSVGLLLILFYNSALMTPQKGGFTRSYNGPVPVKIRSYTLRSNSLFIHGILGKDIVLGNFSAPHLLYLIDTSFLNNRTAMLKMEDNPVYQIPTFNVCIRGDYLFVLDGSNGSVYMSYTNSLQTKKQKTMDRFESGVVSGTDVVFTKVQNAHNSSFYLQSINLKNNQATKNDSLCHSLNDIFLDDGQLAYNDSANELMYSYYFKNKILVYDTNLNYKRTINTIDTFNSPNLTIDSTGSSGKITFSKPPTIVNKKITVENGALYVQSGLLAENDEISKFNSGTIFDIYSLNDGLYFSSFQIPNVEGKKLASFFIVNNRLYTVHKNILTIYDLSLHGVNNFSN